MKIHYLIIAILTVSMLVIGAMNFLNDLGENYGETADLSSLNQTRERLDTQNELNQQLREDITDFELENPVDFFAIPYKMIKVGWTSAKTVFNSWATVETMAEEVESGLDKEGLGLPDWVVPSIVSVLVIIIVSILIYAFFKWKFED